MSDYRYPDEFIKKAEARIRKQLDGNGIDPKTVTLTVKRQGMGEFSAQTSFQIDFDIDKREKPGRHPVGETVETGQAQSKVQDLMADIQDNQTVREEIKTRVEALLFKGFGAEKHTIPLKQHEKIFSEIHVCGVCEGRGQSHCQTCRGQGQIPCNLCHQRGMIHCPLCNGVGELQQGGEKKVCTQCHGKREIFCTQCYGQKLMPCPSCQNRGTISCSACHGEGANTLTVAVKPYVETRSEIHLQELEYEPKTMANKIGPLPLAKGGHIQIDVTKPPEQEEDDRAYHQDAPEDTIKSIVYYSLKTPWAVGEVTINGKGYNIYFLGYKGAIADSQPFMDALIEKPLKLFESAVDKNNKPREFLNKVTDYRVSRETLKWVIKKGRKRAMKEIHRNYKIGFPTPSIQNFVQAGYKAINALTRKWRYVGLEIGLFLSPFISYFWFFEGYRQKVSTAHIYIEYSVDFIVLLAMIIATILCIKLTAWFPYKNLAQKLGIKSLSLPPIGDTGKLAIGWSIFSWLTGFINLFIAFY
jgi:DnaJ-class molecular chaperone